MYWFTISWVINGLIWFGLVCFGFFTGKSGLARPWIRPASPRIPSRLLLHSLWPFLQILQKIPFRSLNFFTIKSLPYLVFEIFFFFAYFKNWMGKPSSSFYPIFHCSRGWKMQSWKARRMQRFMSSKTSQKVPDLNAVASLMFFFFYRISGYCKNCQNFLFYTYENYNSW